MYAPKWSARTYTEEEFISAWNSARSISDCARMLGLTIYGSTYSTIKNTAKYLELSDNHMVGQGWRSKIREGESAGLKKSTT